ncbi:hypothetical protein SAMN05421755_10964 [Nitrosomonas sp. Nm33]|nr:hypothetical protein SAMN05421755_10964 [Nitrosomonas sp. Nm33]
MLKPIPGNGMITPNETCLRSRQRDSIRTYKDPSVAMMRGATACAADASESRIAGRYANVIPSPEKELSP